MSICHYFERETSQFYQWELSEEEEEHGVLFYEQIISSSGLITKPIKIKKTLENIFELYKIGSKLNGQYFVDRYNSPVRTCWTCLDLLDSDLSD